MADKNKIYNLTTLLLGASCFVGAFASAYRKER